MQGDDGGLESPREQLRLTHDADCRNYDLRGRGSTFGPSMLAASGPENEGRRIT